MFNTVYVVHLDLAGFKREPFAAATDVLQAIEFQDNNQIIL